MLYFSRKFVVCTYTWIEKMNKGVQNLTHQKEVQDGNVCAHLNGKEWCQKEKSKLVYFKNKSCKIGKQRKCIFVICQPFFSDFSSMCERNVYSQWLLFIINGRYSSSFVLCSVARFPEEIYLPWQLALIHNQPKEHIICCIEILLLH